MNSELKEMGKQLKEILDKYPNRQKEILFYIFGEDTIRKIVNKPTYEELEQKVNRLEKDKIHLIEIISGLINYVKDTYDEDLTDKTAEVMEMVLDEVGGSNE